MSAHQKFVAVAQRLIDKNGRTVTFKSVAPADSGTPWKRAAGPSTIDVATQKAAFVPFRGFDFGGMITHDDLLTATSEICLVAGGNDAFDGVQIINDAGQDLKVEWCRRLRPGDQTVLYAYGVNR